MDMYEIWCTLNVAGLFSFYLRLADVSNFQHKICFIQNLYIYNLPLDKLSHTWVQLFTSKSKIRHADTVL
jgi:hypothetical protein